MLTLCVANVLFQMQTFHNIWHNYKWVLLALLASSLSSSPGGSASCLLSSATLNELTWAWSAGWLMLDWKLKRTPYLEQAIQGRKVCKPRTKREVNEIMVIIATWTLNSSTHTFSKRERVKVTYSNGYISFGVRNKRERETKGTENRGENGHISAMCIYNSRNNEMKIVFCNPQSQLQP